MWICFSHLGKEGLMLRNILFQVAAQRIPEVDRSEAACACLQRLRSRDALDTACSVVKPFR